MTSPFIIGGDVADDYRTNVPLDNKICIESNLDAKAYSKLLKKYKDEHNHFKHQLNECYKIVLDFIKRKKRILVGGMSIDYALKLKGDLLYDTLEVDYDFISPEYHKDAYELGSLIAKKFDNVSVIGAMHVSTMRVRYVFMPVADIGYVPENIYNQIKTIEYEGIRVIHPHFQMMDQLRALRSMGENPPVEPYLSDRVEKDIDRFTKLNKYYDFPPIDNKSLPALTMTDIEIPFDYLLDNCLVGFPSAIYWMEKTTLKSSNSIIINDNSITCKMPSVYSVDIFSDNADNLIKSIGGEVIGQYNRFLDKLPSYTLLESKKTQSESKKTQSESKKTKPESKKTKPESKKTQSESKKTRWSIYDSKGSVFVAEPLIKDKSIYVMGIYGTMMWLLMKYLFDSDLLAGFIFKHLLYSLLSETNYHPNVVQFYGEFNWSDSYLMAKRKHLAALSNTKLSNLLPKNAYPNLGEIIDDSFYQFDPNSSEILQIDGALFIEK